MHHMQLILNLILKAVTKLFKGNVMLNKTSILILVAVISLIAVTACSVINKKLGLKDDNVAEECIEAVIDHKTGLQIDLTPSSPEVAKK